MNTVDEELEGVESGIAKLPLAAAVLAMIGIADAGYLTVSHYTKAPVPCSIVEGCETVLTSSYAELGGIPIAAFGAAAYFVAFSLAMLAAYGNRTAWTLFGVQSLLMAAVSAYLLYVQGFVIGAFCQFCLISAATSIGLFLVFLASKFLGRR
jgi:uncharacterized membrane protein